MSNIDVEKFYNDSMLYISEEEKESVIQKFNDVVEQAKSIFELDTDGLDYFEITCDDVSPLREDEPSPCIDREDALLNTKHREYGYFKIGKVVD